MNVDWTEHDLSQRYGVPSTSTPGLTLTLRGRGAGRPVLFVHGATFSGRIFDIPHPRVNWLQAAADAGFTAYALDIRGYGLSKPNAFPTDRAYATGDEAVADITDAMNWIATRHGGEPIGLVGWSWGTITARRYAAGPGKDRVSGLVLYAPIHAEVNEGWIDMLADPADRRRLRNLAPYRLVDMADTRARWNAQLPLDASWRRDDVMHALVASSIADDGPGVDTDPPSFRVPNGTFMELWKCFNGNPVHDPADVKCPCLLVRGSNDPTATRSDSLTLMDSLGAEDRSYLEIAGGTHFINAEVRAPALFNAVHAFLHRTG